MKLFLTSLLVVGAIALPKRPTNLRGPVTIGGGNETTQGQFPYQLSFQKSSYLPPLHFCGAILYGPYTAITAAQCVYGENYDEPFHLELVAGELSLSEDSGLEQRRKVTKIIIHEEYGPRYLLNDIAILQVSDPFLFDDNIIDRIDIANSETKFTGDSCVASGWGAQVEWGESTDILHYVDIPVLTDEQCWSYHTPTFVDSNICAGEPGKYTCDYDTGGPLVCDGVLAGIVSYDTHCGMKGYPGYYTKVSHYYDWIIYNTWK